MTLVFNLLSYRPVSTGLSIYVERLLQAWHGPLPPQLKLSSDGSLVYSTDPFLPSCINSYLMRFASSLAAAQYLVPTKHIIRSSSPSQIYSPYPDYLWSARNIPQTVTCHDLSTLYFPNSRRAYIYARHILPKHLSAAARIVAISKSVANQLVDLDIPPSKVEVVYNGVDICPPSSPINKGFDCVCIARHSRNKNLPLTLFGFHKFLCQQPDWPGSLIVIGSSGRLTHTLHKLANKLSLTDRVKWVSHLQDHELRSLLTSAFCLISSSLMEGFDYPLLEAQSLGLPTLASSIPVHEELHHNTALFFSLDDYGDTMAHQLLRLSREPGLWRQLSQAGLCNAAAHSSQRQAQELQHLLQGPIP